MKKFIPLIFLLVACDDDEPQRPVVDGSKMIVEAKVFRWAELPDTIRKRAHTGWIDGNTMGSSAEKIEKETAYYLRLTLQNDLVAKASCDTNILKEPGLMDQSNLHAIYGKYRNFFYVYDETGKEVRLEERRSHTRINIFRTGGIDTTYWGPLEKRPDSLEFSCYYLDSSNQPRLRIR